METFRPFAAFNPKRMAVQLKDVPYAPRVAKFNKEVGLLPQASGYLDCIRRGSWLKGADPDATRFSVGSMTSTAAEAESGNSRLLVLWAARKRKLLQGRDAITDCGLEQPRS